MQEMMTKNSVTNPYFIARLSSSTAAFSENCNFHVEKTNSIVDHLGEALLAYFVFETLRFFYYVRESREEQLLSTYSPIAMSGIV